jgi:hypothetical protein
VYELVNDWTKHKAPGYAESLRALGVLDGVPEAEALAWRVATAVNDCGWRAGVALRQCAANVACGSDMRWWADPPAVSNAFAAAADALTP